MYIFSNKEGKVWDEEARIYFSTIKMICYQES